jgi:Putative adhesin
MHHEYPADNSAFLTVEIESGSVEVAATDTDQVAVELSGSGADDTLVERDGDRLTITGPRSRGFSRSRAVHARITAPSGSDLVTRLGSAPVTASGALGAVRIATGSGDVELAEVTGNAEVRTGSGDVRARRIGGESNLKSGSGDITVGELIGASRLATGSGDITVRHAEDAVSAKSGSGDVRVQEAGPKADLASATGYLEVHRLATGKADLKNVSGNIRVGIPAGTPVWTDIATGTGRVRSGLEPTGAPTDGQPYVELTARTTTGDVYLDQL